VKLFLSRLHFPVTSLGPGRRLGIWVQGCSIRCPGCLSMDTWATGRGETAVQDVVAEVERLGAEIEGVTISGGEPFDQPGALELLLCEIRRTSRVDVLVFTGYPWESLPEFARSAGLIDALITDPYRADVPQSLALRGSDNQRLHLLTPLGHERFASFERVRVDADDYLDIGFDNEGTAWIAGIPRRDDVQRLLSGLRRQGHQASGVHEQRGSE
jgi:anaerobic ribonucleoside-triphosphate reductase activating protein